MQRLTFPFPFVHHQSHVDTAFLGAAHNGFIRSFLCGCMFTSYAWLSYVWRITGYAFWSCRMSLWTPIRYSSYERILTAPQCRLIHDCVHENADSSGNSMTFHMHGELSPAVWLIGYVAQTLRIMKAFQEDESLRKVSIIRLDGYSHVISDL